ncbi:hypothetical protein TNCV_3172521 [Trichonephila clavipes]|nr:hypothetical protein TNCV_3172521 [Trichonephila clavipes]
MFCVHYPMVRQFKGFLERSERLRVLEFHGRTSCYSDYSQFVAAEIIHNAESQPRPCIRVLATTTFYNALCKAAFSGIVSNMDAVITIPKIKAGFIRKDNVLPINPPSSVFLSQLQTQL